MRQGVSSVLLQAVRAGADYGGEVVLVDPLEAASNMGKECVAAQGAMKQALASDGMRTVESLVSEAYPHLQKACTLSGLFVFCFCPPLSLQSPLRCPSLSLPLAVLVLFFGLFSLVTKG